ncbi:MAG: tetratricopeptide repeat protein [Bacteroidales bacterium]|nr:tetratricopeptide repeat protein [Bacteroidales bacterium]HOY39867.1 tetratricopeptide repeat protein [Bacteroidales bacterium]HQP05100.1 tetratricopeptide repeat protein [Bacteroidales bacterium]
MSKEKKIQKQAESNIGTVQNALSRTEQFIENNQKIIIYVIVGLVVVVGGYLAYRSFIQQPREKRASAEMYTAQYYFELDSFKLALQGDGKNAGFLNIIDDYGSTKAGNVANYYAGVCYMRLGEYNTAIGYLEDFDSDDKILKPISIGLIGDANAELGKLDLAIEKYLEAADQASNDFVSPIYLMRAGIAYESLNKWNEALEIYNRIDKEYYGTSEQRNIEKYITRAKLKAGK